MEGHPNLVFMNGLVEPGRLRRVSLPSQLSSILSFETRKINWAKSLLCEMGLGIRISVCLRATESLPVHRFKVDFRLAEFIYHRLFEKWSKENFTVTRLSWGNSLFPKNKNK